MSVTSMLSDAVVVEKFQRRIGPPLKNKPVEDSSRKVQESVRSTIPLLMRVGFVSGVYLLSKLVGVWVKKMVLRAITWAVKRFATYPVDMAVMSTAMPILPNQNRPLTYVVTAHESQNVAVPLTQVSTVRMQEYTYSHMLARCACFH